MAATLDRPTGIKQFVTLNEVAEHFGVTTRTINGWIAQGLFPQPRRIGRRLRRWPVVELNQWIDDGCPAVGEGNR